MSSLKKTGSWKACTAEKGFSTSLAHYDDRICPRGSGTFYSGPGLLVVPPTPVQAPPFNIPLTGYGFQRIPSSARRLYCLFPREWHFDW